MFLFSFQLFMLLSNYFCLFLIIFVFIHREKFYMYKKMFFFPQRKKYLCSESFILGENIGYAEKSFISGN